MELDRSDANFVRISQSGRGYGARLLKRVSVNICMERDMELVEKK